MNLRHPQDVLHSLSIKNNVYDKNDLGLSYFHVTKSPYSILMRQNADHENSEYGHFAVTGCSH